MTYIVRVCGNQADIVIGIIEKYTFFRRVVKIIKEKLTLPILINAASKNCN